MRNKTQVHLVTIMVVDHDKLGIAGVIDVVENERFPNDCIYPRVMSTESVEVEWSDDHPLNRRDWQIAANGLFGEDE